jgi:hypothetical protein
VFGDKFRTQHFAKVNYWIGFENSVPGDKGSPHAWISYRISKVILRFLDSAFRVAMGDLVGNIQPFQDGCWKNPDPASWQGWSMTPPGRATQRSTYGMGLV